MTITVHAGKVRGRVPAPGSKSVTHRGLLLALTAGSGTVHAPLWSADTLATLGAVRAFGAGVVATRSEAVLRADGLQAATIDAKNSGTTLRLATGIAALFKGTSTLSGDASLVRRPMGPLVEALAQIGATGRCLGEDGRPPVEITGPATGGTTRLPGNVSSQFVSSLILAGWRMQQGVTIELTTDLASEPYVEMTCKLMREQGFVVDRTETGYRVPRQHQHPVRVEVPGDYSAAAFPLVAAAITGGDVTVTNLPVDSGQGDEKLPDILRAFGCRVERVDDTIRLSGGDLKGARVDLANNPDLFPPLCVLAACARGETTFFGAPHLKHKESDRIAAMVDGLNTLGIDAKARDDGAVIEGGKLHGGLVESLDDHRIQMAFAVAGLVSAGAVGIVGPVDAHAVSYPLFLEHMRQLGATLEVGL